MKLIQWEKNRINANIYEYGYLIDKMGRNNDDNSNNSCFFLPSYVEERPWWPIQSPNKGRKKKAEG